MVTMIWVPKDHENELCLFLNCETTQSTMLDLNSDSDSPTRKDGRENTHSTKQIFENMILKKLFYFPYSPSSENVDDDDDVCK